MQFDIILSKIYVLGLYLYQLSLHIKVTSKNHKPKKRIKCNLFNVLLFMHTLSIIILIQLTSHQLVYNDIAF